MSISKDAILKAIGAQPDRLGKRELAKIIGVSADEKRELRGVLAQLIDAGEITKSDRRTYSLAGTIPGVTIVTVSRIDSHGDMIGTPAGYSGSGEAPEFIIRVKSSRGKTDEAKLGIGGRALCRMDLRADPPIAEVIKVLGRGPQRMMGVTIATGRGLRIKPVSKKERDEFIPSRDSDGVKAGDLVMFEAQSQSRRSRDGFRPARIVERLGSADDPKSASLISLMEHNIPMGFDDDVVEQAQSLKLPALSASHKDLRDLPLITIDPDDAKDFDDAIYGTPNDDGSGYTVWVAIADVAAFVTPASPLDKSALRKGNSVYLPDRVEPMLPHELSSDLCSLRPHEDRACLAVKMSFNARGEKTGHHFTRGLMRSKARLTYEQAQAAFDGHPGETASTVKDILAVSYETYKALREARDRRGPLEIDVPERRVRIGEDGAVKAIEIRDRFDAHKLVEEFMIQANVAAAEALTAKNMDLIFRVHDQPSRERLQGLSDFLPAVNLKWTLGERATPQRFNKLLAAASETDLSEVVGMAVLRTQSQAVYSPKNDGHFGLNLTHYAHFTSPIRRYADLIVHRALIKAFDLGKDGLTDREVTQLQEISEHISDTERRAMAAERDAKDRYIAAYLSDQIGAKFGARINGVTKFGLFVTLDETGADGLVPLRNLGQERYRFDDRARCVIGEETGGTYRFGQRVVVKLEEAVPVSGGLVFEMMSAPEPGKPGKGARAGRRGGYNSPPRSTADAISPAGRSHGGKPRAGAKSKNKNKGKGKAKAN